MNSNYFEYTPQEQNQDNQVLDWNSTIDADAGKFENILLQPGEYSFMVKNWTQKEYQPRTDSGKIPPCPMAEMQLEIESDQGTVQVFDNLYLAKNMEWKLAQFFTSIGFATDDGQIQMRWDQIIGKTGRVNIQHREYNGTYYNRVEAYLPPLEDDGFMAGQAQGWSKGAY